jgi:hypothetical protein
MSDKFSIDSYFILILNFFSQYENSKQPAARELYAPILIDGPNIFVVSFQNDQQMRQRTSGLY